jgi:hypothetical protein
MMNYKVCGRKQLYEYFKHHPDICLEAARKVGIFSIRIVAVPF